MKLVHKFKRLRIRGKWWRFDWNYRGREYAWCIPEERLIKINLRKHKTVAALVNTLVHEISHAIVYDLPHKEVYALSAAVQRALTEGGIVCG